MFNQKVDLKLISLVRKNPVLYDFGNGKYMDFNTREVAWQRIGDELRRPAGDCKVRWINIRDVHRRILRKNLALPKAQHRAYKYEAEMAFMRPFYKDVPKPPPEDESDRSESDAADDANEHPPAEYDSDQPDSPKTKPAAKTGKKRKKKKNDDDLLAPSSVENGASSAEYDTSDPVDAFLLSIGATLKTFSPYHLNVAKSKIFAVVQEHDLQQIVQKSEIKVPVTDAIYMERTGFERSECE